MERLLIIPVLIFLISPILTHMFWGKRWTERKKSKAYIRKFFWGFRYFLGPVISLHVLLNFGLQAFCITLLSLAVVNILLRLIFGTDKTPVWTHKLGYLWFLFLGATFYQNDPYWIQIWASIFPGILFSVTFLAALLKKPHWLGNSHFAPETSSDTEKTFLKWSFPTLFLMFALMNEFVRKAATFETWAFYNAFHIQAFILIFGTCTIIFVPIFFRDREGEDK